VDEKNLKIGIIGAGIQGVCNALFLQKKGFQVTLFDREEPGSAASYGNAGHFSPYASVPLNRPDILTDVPAMLISSTGPLALKWNYVPKMIPWFFKLIKNCTTKKMMHTAKYMHQILDLALPAYDELFDEIDLDGLVKKNGIMYVWTKKNIASRELEIKQRVFLAWLAPRGIVTAAVASLFSIRLEQAGVLGAGRLQGLVFLTILMTVGIQGLTARPLANFLDLIEKKI